MLHDSVGRTLILLGFLFMFMHAAPAHAVDEIRQSATATSGTSVNDVSNAFVAVWNDGPYDCTQELAFGEIQPNFLFFYKNHTPISGPSEIPASWGEQFELEFGTGGTLSSDYLFTMEIGYNPDKKALTAEFGSCKNSGPVCTCSGDPGQTCDVPTASSDICPGLGKGVCEAPTLTPLEELTDNLIDGGLTLRVKFTGPPRGFGRLQ